MNPVLKQNYSDPRSLLKFFELLNEKDEKDKKDLINTLQKFQKIRSIIYYSCKIKCIDSKNHNSKQNLIV